jgi:hypothetical protein
MKTMMVVTKYLLLVVLMFVLWIVCISGATAVVGYQESAMNDESANRALAAMLFVSAINTGILTYTILRSRWHGLRLVAVVALQIFGIQFFISQIETLYFNYGVKMPNELILAIVIGGFVMAWVFALVAVLLLGKMKKNKEADESTAGLSMPRKELAIKFIVLAAVVYPAIYILAGHFIAWQFEDVRVMYSGSAVMTSFSHQFSLAYLQSWLYPYQVVRGALWILIALPVIRMLKGGGWERALVVGLLFAGLMCTQLLLPNPYMPGNVAYAHFLETFSSNLLWGFLVVWFMHRHHASLREFFQS